MEISSTLAILALFLQVCLIVKVQAQATVFDITDPKYGAKVNTEEDISTALDTAWKEACSGTTPSKILIPKGSFFLNQAKLEGPCKGGPIEIEVQATIKAPLEASQLKAEGEWFTVNYVDEFTLSGGGTFDGQGAAAWKTNDCSVNVNCNKRPNNLNFNFLKKSHIRDITSLNSKSFHVSVGGCEDVTFENFHVVAPGDSPNTDGIHIGRSKGITITDSTFATGDDCISLGDGSQQITIEKVTCGPGHGISIGSLGKFDNEQDVVGVNVRNCTLTGTTNGVRIKSWPDLKACVASDMHFDDIILNDVENPILIDQMYCPWNQCSNKNPSRVKLSKISFKNIKGTTKTPLAVKFLCSSAIPCEGVEVGDIDLTYTGTLPGPITTECTNVTPTFTGKQNPPICAGPAAGAAAPAAADPAAAGAAAAGGGAAAA